MSGKVEAFEELVASVQSCTACESMAGCTRVLSWANGDPSASVMFVGEAPGRLGADRTAVPFHGDKAGDNFEKLLSLAGIARRDAFITNAVLCNPRDEKGNNAPPSRKVLQTCARNLWRQIEVIRPTVVVTLGGAALEATRCIKPHDLALSTHVRTLHDWNGLKLIPLYHPGARAMIHRNFSTQSADYYFVGEMVRRLGAKRRAKPKVLVQDDCSWAIVQYVVYKLQSLSLFRLHKIMYLADLRALKEQGEPISSFVYIRQKDGPYCVELGSRWFKAFEANIKTFSVDSKLHVAWNGNGLFDAEPKLPGNIRQSINKILTDTTGLDDSQLKTRVYLTGPMKAALRLEQGGMRQLNKPLL